MQGQWTLAGQAWYLSTVYIVEASPNRAKKKTLNTQITPLRYDEVEY